MTIDDPVTLAERYVKASAATNLTPDTEGRTALDVLIAAARSLKDAKQTDRDNWDAALRVQRMLATNRVGDDLDPVVRHYDAALNGHLSRKGRRPMPKDARRYLIVCVLQWKLSMWCPACNGTGHVAQDGDEGRGKILYPCEACHGSGVRPLARAVPHAHALHARWLVDVMDQHAREAFKEMRVLLTKGSGF